LEYEAGHLTFDLSSLRVHINRAGVTLVAFMSVRTPSLGHISAPVDCVMFRAEIFTLAVSILLQLALAQFTYVLVVESPWG
jgi:hypothetical protein